MPALIGMAPTSGDGLPPTITAAEIAPCFNCSMAALASSCTASTPIPSALNRVAAAAAEAEPAGPKLTLLAGEAGQGADIGAGQDVDLLRGQPGDQLELVGEAFILGRLLGKNIGRDERQVDIGIVEEQREIAGAGIAEHGQHA